MNQPKTEKASNDLSDGNGRIVAEAKNVFKRFGATQALSDVSIQIQKGDIHGLVGRNGAGKSTLVGVLTGLLAPDAGQLFLQSKPVPRLSEREEWRRLVACVYQKPTVVPALSVAENLFLGNLPLTSRDLVRWGEMRKLAREALLEWGIDVDENTEASRLTVNQRHLVEIIRALLLGTRFIILDEPTAGLEAGDIKLLFERIRSLRASGVSFVYISHHLDEVFELCDRVTILRDGQKVMSKDMDDLSRKEMVSAMVGSRRVMAPISENASLNHPSPESPERNVPLLDVIDLTVEGFCKGVNLQVYPGECVGLAGHRGSGITAVADSIVGLIPYKTGQVKLFSRLLVAGRPDKAVQAGVGYVPEDRYTRGFVGCMSATDNLTLPVLDRLGRWGLVSLKKQRIEASRLVKELDIKVASIKQHLYELSGGNQQKTTLGRALSSSPKLCVLVDPTAGVDVASKEGILTKVRNLRDQGRGLLLVSDDEEDLRVCDRIVVMFQGCVFKEIGSGWEARDLVMAMEGWADGDDRSTGGIQ
jgi:simple sugar transport system ATP-binding protein